MGKIITKGEFQKTSDEIHKKKYTLLSEYRDAHTKCVFVCNECNLEFEQTPNHHKKMKLCPCKRSNEIIDLDSIKEKLVPLKYTIKEDTYHSSHKKCTFVCPEHGEFKETPYNIISGKKIGCKKCSKESFVNKVRKTNEEFIKEAKSIHGDLYNYDRVDYLTANDKITINCVIHGDFKQTPSNHLKGRGCPKCGDIRTKEATKNKFENIVKQFRQVHGDRYEYPNQDYINNKHKIKIVCKIHGEFYQSNTSHLLGQNCPKCYNI